MKATKKMASTAKKRAQRLTQNQCIIIALASVAVSNGIDAAARAAITDMAQDEAKNISVNYTWDPFDGMLA